MKRTKYPISNNEKLRREKISRTMKLFYKDPKNRERVRKNSTGRKHSDETKAKLSKLRSGKGNGMYGRRVSEETKKKAFETKKRNETLSHSQETKDKISKANKGKPRSKELRKRISKALKKHFSNHPGTFLGKLHSEEAKQKMREANTDRFRGENGPNWQGGIGSLPYGIEWTVWLRMEIKERDSNQCKICKDKKMLDVHHIDFNKLNNNSSNLITLCKHHHGKANRHAISQVKLKSLISLEYATL